MITRGGFLVAAILLFATPAEAQTLILCDAEWMDAERVLALIAVEVEEPSRYVFKVTDCHEASAQVAVRGPEGLDRRRDVRLAATAPEARSRLVALVLVELVRLGIRRAPPPPSEAPEAEGATNEPASVEEPEPAEPSPDPVADGDGEPSALRFPPAPDPYGALDGAEDETEALELPPAPDPYGPLRIPPAPDPYGPVESAEHVDASPGAPDVDPAAGAVGSADEPCAGEGLASRASDRGCSRSLELALGAARHHLGRTAGASLWSFQLRVRYRWRFFFVGARVAGRWKQTAPWSGASVNIASYTGSFGLELVSKRFRSALLAFAVNGELGAIRFRETESGDGCAVVGTCGEVPQSQGSRSTYGVFVSLRLESPVRVGALLVELQGGWTRGLVLTSHHDAVTGLGGGQLSLLAGVAFGVGGDS